MNKGSFVKASNGQAISPSTLVLVYSSLPEFAVIHGIEEVDEKLVGIFLTSRTKLVAISASTRAQ
jgi:hypothetical protein